MRPRLHILKREDARDYTLRTYIRFAVIDLDRSKRYPENFVCILPQNIGSVAKQSSVFTKVFKDKSLELAKKLLADALRVEDDSEIKAEIKRRLQILQPKPPPKKKCVVCGKYFQPKRMGRYRQRICLECRRRRIPSRE